MKTSIATVSINGTLKEKIQAIAKAGFDGVEIFENDFLTNNLSPKEVKNLVKDNGLEITLFQPFRDFEGMPDKHRIRAFDRAKKKFDIMACLLYTSDAADDSLRVDLGGRRIIKKR